MERIATAVEIWAAGFALIMFFFVLLPYVVGLAMHRFGFLLLNEGPWVEGFFLMLMALVIVLVVLLLPYAFGSFIPFLCLSCGGGG